MTSELLMPPITWVLIADAKRAQIYKPRLQVRRLLLSGNSKHPHTLDKYERKLFPILDNALIAESTTLYEVERNSTGIVFESFSSTRHMAEPRLNIRKQVKQDFAQRIADMLNHSATENKFDRLVLVAPPEMLGEINAKLDKKIRSKVTAKLAKELTHCGEAELSSHLDEYL